jgi:hypothetical protein
VPTVNQRLARAQAADPEIFLPKLARQIEILARDLSLFFINHDATSLAPVRDMLDALAPVVRGDIGLDSDAIEAIDGLVSLLSAADHGAKAANSCDDTSSPNTIGRPSIAMTPPPPTSASSTASSTSPAAATVHPATGL